jgi:hypothetical protein
MASIMASVIDNTEQILFIRHTFRLDYNAAMKTIGRLLLVFLLLSMPAFAADVTLFGGWQHEGKIALTTSGAASAAAATVVKNPFNGGVFGLRVASGRVWGHEETLAYAPNFIDSKSKAVILNSNFMLAVPTPVVKPYITVGLGTFVVSGSGESDIGTKFAINYGGGVKLMPSGPIGVRLDLRNYSLFSIQSHRLNAFETSLGVVFHF